MPTKNSTKALSKLLFAILGSNPDAYGIVLDEENRASIRDLYAAIRQEDGFSWITPGRLRQFFLFDTSGLFLLEDDLVRLSETSLVKTVLTYEESLPPRRLYASIRQRALENTAIDGLFPPSGKAWVVLARSVDMARRIGERKDPEPVLVEVMADQAARSGKRFYAYGENLFLVERVEARWIRFLPFRPRKTKAPKIRHAPCQKTSGLPGGFTLELAHLDAAGQARKVPSGKRWARTGQGPAWKENRRNPPRL